MSNLATDTEPGAEMHPQPLLKIGELEYILRIDRRTVFRLCQTGQLPKPIRIGGSRRWRKQDIDRLINESAEATKHEDCLR